MIFRLWRQMHEKEMETHKPLVTYRSAAADNLSIFKERQFQQDGYTGELVAELNGMEIRIGQGVSAAGIGVNLQKLLIFGMIAFTGTFSKANRSEHYEVSFRLDDYIRITRGSGDNDPEQYEKAKYDVQKRIKRELLLLQSIRCTWSDNKGNFDSVSLVYRATSNNGMITIGFSPPFAAHLLKQKKTTVHPALFRIDARNSTAYAIGWKLTGYRSMNKRRPDQANRIRVKNLLKVTTLPKYNDVRKRGQGWSRKIRKPFEKAMNDLVKIGLLKSWKYETQIGSSYYDFSGKIVCFELAEPYDF